MNKRNYKVSGKKLEKDIHNDFDQFAVPRTAQVAWRKARGLPIGTLTLEGPSRRREKKAVKKFQAGGFDFDKRFGRYELYILKGCVQDEMRYDTSY